VGVGTYGLDGWGMGGWLSGLDVSEHTRVRRYERVSGWPVSIHLSISLSTHITPVRLFPGCVSVCVYVWCVFSRVAAVGHP